MKYAKQDVEESREVLLRWLKPGDTIYTVLRHVSRSGMSRKIDLYKIEDGQPIFLTGHAARVLGDRWDRDTGGIVVQGCGMDMGFEVVYRLGYALYPDGFNCAGDHCPSCDHSNREDNAHHSDGGYALRQRWM